MESNVITPKELIIPNIGRTLMNGQSSAQSLEMRSFKTPSQFSRIPYIPNRDTHNNNGHISLSQQTPSVISDSLSSQFITPQSQYRQRSLISNEISNKSERMTLSQQLSQQLSQNDPKKRFISDNTDPFDVFKDKSREKEFFLKIETQLKQMYSVMMKIHDKKCGIADDIVNRVKDIIELTENKKNDEIIDQFVHLKQQNYSIINQINHIELKLNQMSAKISSVPSIERSNDTRLMRDKSDESEDEAIDLGDEWFQIMECKVKKRQKRKWDEAFDIGSHTVPDINWIG